MTPKRQSLKEALDRIEKVREQRQGEFYLREDHITLSHGSGGKATRNLVEGVFAPEFSNPVLDLLDDSAVLSVNGTGERIAFTTDTFVVNPVFFPGGDIGRLAVHGTVNDLAVSGATPLYLSAAVILEEGFPVDDLRRIVVSMGEAAEAADVEIVTGDTKVVESGKGDGVYINTAGVGAVRTAAEISASRARPGDRILLSGSIAEHGVAVMIAREDLALETDITSDTAALHGLTAALLDRLGDDVRCMRDATRGGVAAVLNEIATRSGVGVAVEESRVPVRRDVRGACEILGIDPLQIANEGRLLAVVAPDRAEEALETLRSHPLGESAALVGEVLEEPDGMVFVRTGIGGRRVLDMLVGDALPRIC